ncbi:MAG: radical SAM protein [Eggerthella sp.]|uniref:radical SAM protein n=1 Tax=Eggerthella sp. TaxID=1929886 RepID=UPI002908B3E7|nr:radical SAM protein [Eggerthella sp.]MDU5064272.1 radical SAM protein [Eggerthella sp.]
MIGTTGNAALERCAQSYRDIEDDFKRQAASFGLPFAEQPGEPRDEALARLARQGVVVSNDGKSVHRGWLSPSCEQCRKGLNTATFLLSVQCPKQCFFCFNPNQLDYERLLTETNDVVAELEGLLRNNAKLTDIALTGGEPLAHAPEALAFFDRARTLCPEAYLRLYTSGSGLDEKVLRRLERASLDEIRFSVKMEDEPSVRAQTLERIARSRSFVPHVVVEMPVMPNDARAMEKLLRELDRIGIDGANLLELCYPLHNAEEFARRGYRIKAEPYRVLYDYWYAGGLPIAGSEEAALRLLEFSVREKLGIGVHYCSLENKLTGQIYLQNNPYRTAFPTCIMSDRDHFLKTARVFGSDIAPVVRMLEEAGVDDYAADDEDASLAFSPAHIALLAHSRPDMPVALGYCIVESEGSESVRLRELKIDITTPSSFDLNGL